MPLQVTDSDLESEASDQLPIRAKGKQPMPRSESDGDEFTQEPSKTVEDEEDDEGDEDSQDSDEYVVELIEDHRWDDDEDEFKYKIKWEGYVKRTWEPMTHLTSAMLRVREYFQKLGFEPNANSQMDRNWKGFKEESKRGGRLYTGSLPSSEYEKPLKRKFSKTTDEVSSSASGKRSKSEKRLMRESEDDESEEVVDVKTKKGVVYPPDSPSWESAIRAVETIDRTFDPRTGEQILWAIISWKNGQREYTRHRLKLLRKRAPQKLLSFYERHIVLKHHDIEDDSRLDDDDDDDADSDDDQ